MMNKRILFVLSLLLVMSLGFVTVGEASDFSGTGKIWAKGVGYAEIHGDGTVDIRGHGRGIVLVKGADELRAQGNGRRWDLPNGTTLFTGWRGHIYTEGDELLVKMLGGLIEFTAEGTGTVFLRGRGVYRINGKPGLWSEAGVSLELLPTTEAP